MAGPTQAFKGFAMIQSGQMQLQGRSRQVSGDDGVYYVRPDGKIVSLPAGNVYRDTMRKGILADSNHRVALKNAAGDVEVKQWRLATKEEIKKFNAERAAFLAEKHQQRERRKLENAPAVLMVDKSAVVTGVKAE